MRETPQQPMDAESFRFLEGIEPGHFWFEARRRLLLTMLARYFPAASSYFELGSGTGFLLDAVGRRFPDWRLVGSDLTTATLPRVARRVPRAGVVVTDALAPGLGPGSSPVFDVIGAFDVLEHIADDRRVLRNLHRLIRPGGGIVIMVPQHAWLWSVADDYAEHERRYEREELVEKATEAGFAVQRATSFTALLLPLLMASRRRMPRQVEDYVPGEEIEIGAVANWGLSRVMELEWLAIRAGVSFRRGGSLLLVARKAGA